MNVNEAAAEVRRRCDLRDQILGSNAPPLYAPRLRRVVQDILVICRFGYWDDLPEALRELENVRDILDREVRLADDTRQHNYRQGCADISAALGKLREATMAEMSSALCR